MLQFLLECPGFPLVQAVGEGGVELAADHQFTLQDLHRQMLAAYLAEEEGTPHDQGLLPETLRQVDRPSQYLQSGGKGVHESIDLRHNSPQGGQPHLVPGCPGGEGHDFVAEVIAFIEGEIFFTQALHARGETIGWIPDLPGRDDLGFFHELTSFYSSYLISSPAPLHPCATSMRQATMSSPGESCIRCGLWIKLLIMWIMSANRKR